MNLRLGDLAPDFALAAQDGVVVTLSRFHGVNAVVLIFYPRDDTYGCTKQLCAARDDAEEYKLNGVAVLGINGGTAGSHLKFVERHRLTTPLLVDEGLRVSEQYGAVFKLGPFRVIKRTVVGIDRKGCLVYYRRGQPGTHEVTAALRSPTGGES